jgi:hypothetical protein
VSWAALWTADTGAKPTRKMNPSPKSNASAPTRVRSFGETSVRSFGRAVARDSDTVVVVMRSLAGDVETRGIIATGSVEGQFDILAPL